MASNRNPVVAQWSLGKSTPRKCVLPIKENDTHIWLHSSAHIIIQQVADAVLYRAERSNSFAPYLLRGPSFPSERPNLGLSCHRQQGGFNCNL